MARLEGYKSESAQSTLEVVFPKESKYAYHIMMPKSAKKKDIPLRILIWGHGSIDGPDYGIIIEKSQNEISMLEEYCNKHNIIAIMPVLPRTSGTKEVPPLDAQMIGSPTILHNWDNFYYRPDQDIIKTTNLLIKELTKKKYTIKEKFLVGGISAGANMANRLAMLYPKLFSAVAIPLAGNYCYPEIEINGVQLPYPFGYANVTEISEIEPNSREYTKLPFFLYDGELDNKPQNDPLQFETQTVCGVSENQLRQLFGQTPFNRFQHFTAYLKNIGAKVTSTSSANLGHRIDEDTLDKIFQFFDDSSN